MIVLESDFCVMKGSCVKFCPDDNLRNNAGFFELPDLSNGLDIVLPFIDIKEFLYQGFFNMITVKTIAGAPYAGSVPALALLINFID